MQLKKLSIKANNSDDYPFSIPLIRNSPEIEFKTPITIIVGENGTGKSTLLEALAVASNLPIVGADDAHRDLSLEPARKLAKLIQLSWGIRNRRGFFMRAEDFFGFQKKIAKEMEELREQKDEYQNKFTGMARLLSVGSTEAQLKGFESRYGEDPDAFSHGESFLNLFYKRLSPKGLYVLDEPEVPLSPKRQLTLISMIKTAVEKESQFIIATHSPILMALPEATILEIKQGNISNIKYEDLDHVNLMKDFLNNPQSFLRHL